MNKLLDQFTSYLEEQVRNHSIYVWGAQGQTKSTITESWIRTKENSNTNANRAIAFWKKQILAGYGDVLRAFDCSGLGMYWLCNIMKLYTSDMSAHSMMGKCEKITRDQLKYGDWVFRLDTSRKAYHIGYIVDDKLNVVEAKGRDDGVIKRSINSFGSTYWNAYGRPNVFKTEIENISTLSSPTILASRNLKLTDPMMRGDDVRILQERLNKLGYSCGASDGVYGVKTDTAIRKYQSDVGLTVDGIVGVKTRAGLQI